jgi:four helix bundle protein
MQEVKIKSFTDLIAWQKSHILVLEVVKACKSLHSYDFVRMQIERAALSITSNIAEGFGRQSTKDKKHFYVMARGSAYEVQNQLLVLRDTSQITKKDFENLEGHSLESIKLLHGLIRSLERDKC